MEVAGAGGEVEWDRERGGGGDELLAGMFAEPLEQHVAAERRADGDAAGARAPRGRGGGGGGRGGGPRAPGAQPGPAARRPDGDAAAVRLARGEEARDEVEVAGL